ncbi:hypothetical protein [Carp edema virus]|nr:hypothetical protein [Carp edema virus]
MQDIKLSEEQLANDELRTRIYHEVSERINVLADTQKQLKAIMDQIFDYEYEQRKANQRREREVRFEQCYHSHPTNSRLNKLLSNVTKTDWTEEELNEVITLEDFWTWYYTLPFRPCIDYGFLVSLDIYETFVVFNIIISHHDAKGRKTETLKKGEEYSRQDMSRKRVRSYYMRYEEPKEGYLSIESVEFESEDDVLFKIYNVERAPSGIHGIRISLSDIPYLFAHSPYHFEY